MKVQESGRFFEKKLRKKLLFLGAFGPKAGIHVFPTTIPLPLPTSPYPLHSRKQIAGRVALFQKSAYFL
jgi:hypothetical protein